MIGLLYDCFWVSFKSLGASSVGLPIAECNMTVTRQLQPFIVVLYHKDKR